MSHEEPRDFSQKHPAGQKPDPRIETALQGLADRGEISCAEAFRVASQAGVGPAEVGKTIDLTGLRLVKCQLGLFGYKPEKSILRPPENVPETLERAIRDRLSGGRLSCEAAWGIAAALRVPKLEVAGAAEALKIRIKPCQLGAF